MTQSTQLVIDHIDFPRNKSIFLFELSSEENDKACKMSYIPLLNLKQLGTHS